MAAPAPVLAPISRFDSEDHHSVREAFAATPEIHLGQFWLQNAEERFMPGAVRLGAMGGALFVFAELVDEEIVSFPAKFNEPAFKSGDAFEMFFSPEGQNAYYEFHVTPSNSLLQLRFPHPGAAREMALLGRDPLSPYKVREPLFKSRTYVDREGGRWSVLAEIPFASVFERIGEGASRLRASFCRYDWALGFKRPVLSSSSPHAVCDFHRIEEWMIFEVPRQAVLPVQQ
ncbi:MAG TPA: hypothetical protein PLZ86_04195 [bacterium]|nr:hypothetical protein [bacterium]